MENKIFQKNISIDRVFYGFDPKIGLHFYFHYKPFPSLRHAKREREREERVTDPPKINRTPAPAPPSRSNHHRDDTPPRSHHQRRPIHPKPISSAPSLPMTNLVTLSISSQSCRPWPMTDLVAHDPWPISPFPSIFDHSLFLPFSVWPNRRVQGIVFWFLFF